MRILIVDDEANIRRPLRMALEAMGHDVAEAIGRAVIEAGRHTVRTPEACRVEHRTPQTPNQALQQTAGA